MHFTTKRESVAGWLRTEILRGSLPAGSQLQQDQIANRLGLSPTPVREAFSLLIAEGLLVARPHRGVVVAEPNTGEAHEIIAIRSYVEVMATARAAKHISAAILAQLEDLVERAAEAVKRKDLYIFRRTSAAFHELIAEGSGSRVLSEMTKTLTARVLTSVPLDRKRMDKLQKDHTMLVELLKRGDSEGAAGLMQRHVQSLATPLEEAGRPRPRRAARPRNVRGRR